MIGKLALARLPLATLDELYDANPPAPRPAPRHDTERGGRLALSVPGVQKDDRLSSCHDVTLTTTIQRGSAGNPVRIRGCPATVTGERPPVFDGHGLVTRIVWASGREGREQVDPGAR